MSSFQQWDQLYSYLHPDVQAKYTKEQFIEDRKKAGGIFANVKDYKVDKASIVESWTDKDGTGKTYQNAAEVPFILTFNGDKTLRGTIHLAKTNDGTWRYFWSPIKN
ncbi:hypothetical protein skT53_14340 [Effusibacillus dendaii]|uniref:Uncharacterized protein n=2 Tax=Effusibacillus dendaii TaxID=2743772 RepID=A0A7I8DBV4_9BACL|nr:hypothetical protein skT53_14340 [Effusibacillus dendaii]